MRDLYKIFDKVIEKKRMLRFSAHPGGHLSVGIYDNEKQSKQYLYEAKTLDELEKLLKKDFGHLIKPTVTMTNHPAYIPTPMPLPPGFPRP